MQDACTAPSRDEYGCRMRPRGRWDDRPATGNPPHGLRPLRHGFQETAAPFALRAQRPRGPALARQLSRYCHGRHGTVLCGSALLMAIAESAVRTTRDAPCLPQDLVQPRRAFDGAGNGNRLPKREPSVVRRVSITACASSGRAPSPSVSVATRRSLFGLFYSKRELVASAFQARSASPSCCAPWHNSGRPKGSPAVSGTSFCTPRASCCEPYASVASTSCVACRRGDR